MSLILLVEDGVRPPGGLQGNIEYIPFARDSPSECFGSLLEMIRSLAPQQAQAPSTATDATAGDVSAGDTAAKDVPDSPATHWARGDYRTAYFMKILRGDESGASAIAEAYLSSPLAEGDERKAAWEADSEWTKIILGKGGSLARLRELAEEHPNNREIRSHLAGALSSFGEPLEAAESYELAAKLAEDGDGALSELCAAAVSRARASRLDLAMETLDRAKKIAPKDQKGTERILRTLRELASLAKDSDLEVEAMEGLVELFPEDASQRFSLAYNHSQANDDDLAIFHYLKIRDQDRDGITWNNLGVAFQEFGMPGKSIAAYQKASNLGETLAMSNLGYKLMEVGFFSEAEREFNRAIKQEAYHKNVGQGLSELKAAPEKEGEREAEVLQAVVQKGAFYRLLGRAVRDATASLDGQWQGPQGRLAVTVREGTFTATGYFDQSNAFSALTGAAASSRRYVEYEGKVVGRRIAGTIRRRADKDEKPNGTLLGLAIDTEAAQFRMVVSGEGNLIEVMENIRSRNPSFYKLRKIES